MITFSQPDVVTAFPSRLGWMAIIGTGDVLKHLTFGHSSADRAVASLNSGRIEEVQEGRWNQDLVERLQAYASGTFDDFLDIAVDSGPVTIFQRRVLDRTRRVPFGATTTYGQLAAEVGCPGAARAVGRTMATNRVPLVIPCHRVVAANGSLCGFSAQGGVRTKQRLLELEAGIAETRSFAQVSCHQKG
jgi:methylated-DNA-[protein]-cysteine S-methyltransferase